MFKSIKNLYGFLNLEQKRKLYLLQILILFMSFAEVMSVLAIGPFMALVGDIDQLNGDGFVAQIYSLSGVESQTNFLILVALSVLLILVLATLTSMFTIWRLSMYAAQIGADLSSQLYKYYMNQSWLFHASTNSTSLTNKIAQECERVTSGIITPLMQMNAKFVMALIMSFVIFLYNPWVALTGTFVFYLIYSVLYQTVRQQLAQSGTAISEEQSTRFRLMSEGFGGIRDTLLLGRQDIFSNRFKDSSKAYANAKGKTQALGQIPRYAVELIAFGTVISLVLYLLISYEGDLGAILPILSIYVLAGFKLLPAFQQIYFSISQIRSNLSGFENIQIDLGAGMKKIKEETPLHESKNTWSLKSEIKFKEVSFRYPGVKKHAISKLNLLIPVNKVVGLVGSSGSGKSTAVDILLGLINPLDGEITIDGISLSDKNIRSWQNNLGFVSQSIFLADTTIKENVAFGLPVEDIDEESVSKALKMAHLDDLINELPLGLNTKVGERGVQLSGGQRQRIGIARALYNDADILVFDEATSALDGITEKLIMDAIHDFSGKKTIIMIAHRLATVKKCDTIYFLDHGNLIDEGSYDDLALRNSAFKKMAENS